MENQLEFFLLISLLLVSIVLLFIVCCLFVYCLNIGNVVFVCCLNIDKDVSIHWTIYTVLDWTN